MLRNIDHLFGRRKTVLIKSANSRNQIKEKIKILMNFPNDKSDDFSFSVDYNNRDGCLAVTTRSKIVANELTLKLGDLQQLFKDQNLKVNKILIK